MNMPVNFGKVMTRLMTKTNKHDVTISEEMCLSDHTSRWNMDVYLAVDKEMPDSENVKLSGKFYSRVYEGDFRKTGEWCVDFEKKAREKQLTTGNVPKYMAKIMWQL